MLLFACVGSCSRREEVACPAPPPPEPCACALERQTIAQMQQALDGQSKELQRYIAREEKYQRAEVEVTECVAAQETLRTSDNNYEASLNAGWEACQKSLKECRGE